MNLSSFMMKKIYLKCHVKFHIRLKSYMFFNIEELLRKPNFIIFSMVEELILEIISSSFFLCSVKCPQKENYTLNYC